MYIKVRARTGAKKEELVEVSKDHLTVSVKEKPLQNRANTRILELVAAYLRVPVKRVHLVRGHHAPSKIISVE